jgi:hypothetical protein
LRPWDSFSSITTNFSFLSIANTRIFTVNGLANRSLWLKPGL